MAWTYDLNFDGRTASTSDTGGQRIVRVYEMYSDVLAVEGHDAIAALALLAGIVKGVPHPTYAAALCTEVTADSDDEHPYRFMVRVTYQEPKPQPGQAANEDGSQPQPQDRLPQFRMSYRRQDEYRVNDHGPVDLDGVDVVNSAGDLFEQPPPIPVTNVVITITRWYESWNFALNAAYMNKCNNADWYSFPANSLLVTGLEVDLVTERTWLGFKVVWTLEYKPLPSDPNAVDDGQTGAWIPTPILDVGWNLKELAPDPDDPDGPQILVKRAAKDVYGEQLAAPVKLNGTDGQVSDGARYVFRRFYDEIAFTLIG